MVCPFRGSSQDLPQRTGPSSPSTPSHTPCCSSWAQMGLAPFRSRPNSYFASHTPSPRRAASTPNLSSGAGVSSWKNGTKPRQFQPDTHTAPHSSLTVYGPRQVLRGPPPPDEIWEELCPRPPFFRQQRPLHLRQVPECPRDIRARHHPLFGQGACPDKPPSGGPRHWPRRPRLVLGRPPPFH